MSRIGKKPIPLPEKVQAKIESGRVEVKGPKGQLMVPLPEGIRIEQQDKSLVAVRADDTLAARHGLIRSLLANAVQGVSQGFQKDLEIVGIGYRADIKSKSVVLSLGYSHPIEFPIPEGLQMGLATYVTFLFLTQ